MHNRTDGAAGERYGQWADRRFPAGTGPRMNLQFSLAPIIALLAGILILLRPRLLNLIVAIYLIVIGVLGLLGNRI